METSQRAKCSRNPPPRGFHGDGAWGGGALARSRQQMWPVQGWRGVAGGAALCLAAGPWDVAGPGLDAVTSPELWGHRLREASWIHRAGTVRSGLTFCSLPGWAQP